MQLYTIRYSLQHKVSKFDPKGNKISEEVALIEQTLTALPHPTAMQYANLPNFTIVPYTPEVRGKSSFRPMTERTNGRKAGEITVMKSGKGKGKPSSLHHAAATGDLGAAISGGE